jgi:hypothetical protein
MTPRRSTDPVTEPEEELTLDRMRLRHKGGTDLCSRPAAECHRERLFAEGTAKTLERVCRERDEARAEVERMRPRKVEMPEPKWDDET